MNISYVSESFTSNFRTVAIDLIFAVLIILFGQTLGIVFGLNKDVIKSVLDKSCFYMQRVHIHVGAIGTAAVCLIILVCLLGIKLLGIPSSGVFELSTVGVLFLFTSKVSLNRNILNV